MLLQSWNIFNVLSQLFLLFLREEIFSNNHSGFNVQIVMEVFLCVVSIYKVFASDRTYHNTICIFQTSTQINHVKLQLGVDIYICTLFINRTAIWRCIMRMETPMRTVSYDSHAARSRQAKNAMISVNMMVNQ